MNAIYRAIREQGLRTRMIMQVHDELNFEVPLEEVDVFRKVVAECMEAAYTGKVALTASVGISDNWMEAHWSKLYSTADWLDFIYFFNKIYII